MGPLAIPLFFFSSWLAMIFWGMLAPKVALPTIGYPVAMLGTIGLWLVVFPVSRGPRGRPWRSKRRKHTQPPVEASADTVDLGASFGGTARRVTTQNFRGGRVRARFGGLELDLRRAAIGEKPARLDVDAFFGGVELKVPDTWALEIDVSTRFGGISDDRDRVPSPADGTPDLIVSGDLTCGGLSIKN